MWQLVGQLSWQVFLTVEALEQYMTNIKLSYLHEKR